jgi:o-succinylbenzoate synthase
LGSVELHGVEMWRVRLRLRRSIGTSVGTHRRRPVVYVRLVTDGAHGWGESAALEAGTEVDPAHGAVWRAVVEQVVPAMLLRAGARGGSLPSLAELVGGPWSAATRELQPSPTVRAAWAAVEMAVLDALLREERRALTRWWEGAEEVEVGAMVGIPADRSLTSLLDEVERNCEAGMRRVRVKIAPSWDERPLRAVREAFPDLPLLADANGAYRVGTGGAADAERLVALDDLGLVCLEQPLPADQVEAHVQLRSRLATPIGLDESLHSPEALRVALRSGACQVACIKPARFGGLLAGRRALEQCRAAGVATFVGGFFETGLGRMANAALAATESSSLPSDLGPPSTYLFDPCTYPQLQAGRLRLPNEPGVGAAPDLSSLDVEGHSARWLAAPGASSRGGAAAR